MLMINACVLIVKGIMSQNFVYILWMHMKRWWNNTSIDLLLVWLILDLIMIPKVVDSYRKVTGKYCDICKDGLC